MAPLYIMRYTKGPSISCLDRQVIRVWLIAGLHLENAVHWLELEYHLRDDGVETYGGYHDEDDEP
jgi:hypothetical protein